MTFRTVFDATTQGYTTWTFPAVGLIFVALGVLLVTGRLGTRGPRRPILRWFMLLFGIVWTVTAFVSTYGEYRTAQNALSQGRYTVTEGPVLGFVPMPYSGHALERFTVAGQHFSYSDYVVTTGFHQTESHGGPIHPGLHVRVTHVGNLILRLEVAE